MDELSKRPPRPVHDPIPKVIPHPSRRGLAGIGTRGGNRTPIFEERVRCREPLDDKTVWMGSKDSNLEHESQSLERCQLRHFPKWQGKSGSNRHDEQLQRLLAYRLAHSPMHLISKSWFPCFDFGVTALDKLWLTEFSSCLERGFEPRFPMKEFPRSP